MKSRPLTKRQREVLEALRGYVKEHGLPPSRVRLANMLGLKTGSAVEGHLNGLAKKGWISIFPAVERGIRLLREGAPILNPDQLPDVAAGRPIVAEEQPDVPRLHDFESFSGLFECKPDYFLRVKGDSMDRAGIRSGDMVAVRRHPDPNDGDLVVVRIGEEITLKRYHRSKDRIELCPESTNPEHQTLRIDPATEDFEIAGIVVGAIIGTTRATAE